MSTKIDYSNIGKTFNYFTVIGTIKKGVQTFYVCKCVCGNIRELNQNVVLKGIYKSCGCMKYKIIGKAKIRHGQNLKSKTTKEYKAWTAMNTRCYNQKYILFNRYGGRGITVCDRWRHSFENFFEDMKEAPTKKHSLDRFPNNNGNYEPTNCRWATRKEQGRNNSYNVMVEICGIKKCVIEWAEFYRVDPKLIYNRLRKGMSGEDAVLMPKLNPLNNLNYVRNNKLSQTT